MAYRRNSGRSSRASVSRGRSGNRSLRRPARRTARRTGGRARSGGRNQTVRLQLQIVPAQGLAQPFDQQVEVQKAKAKF